MADTSPTLQVEAHTASPRSPFNRVLNKGKVFANAPFDDFHDVSNMLWTINSWDREGPIKDIAEVASYISKNAIGQTYNTGELLTPFNAKRLALAFLELDVSPISDRKYPKEQREGLQAALGVLREAFKHEIRSVYEEMAKATTGKSITPLEDRIFRTSGKGTAIDL